MPVPSLESSTTNTQRALATVWAFLKASNCPEYTKNARLSLKKRILEQDTPQAPLIIAAHNKILKKLFGF
jgi:hypothetical protein